MMDFSKLVRSLEQTGEKLLALTAGIAPEESRWKPEDGAWSILEIMGHLADEEELDFRLRFQMTLKDASQPWPAIDPVNWAIERKYNEGDLTELRERFQTSRATSLNWLRTLQAPDLSNAYQHPQIGPIRAGDLLAAWAAHDLLHMRQITKRLYQLVTETAGEYDTSYAGDWSA